MLSIRLNKEMEEELKKVAKFEGVSVSDYVRNIISEKLEDVYDIKVGEIALEQFEKSNKRVYSFDEVFSK